MKKHNFLSRLLIISSKNIHSSFFGIIGFIFFSMTIMSCEKEPEPIDIGDEQFINTYYTDTITVNVKIFQSDSVSTTSSAGNSRLLMGSLTDEYVGNYSAQAFSNISLISLTEDFQNDAGETAIYDSLVGFFQTDYVYGDTLAENNIEIYEISELFEDQTYYQFDALQTSSTPIGSAVYPNALDTNDVLRVTLSEEFGRNLFNYGLNYGFEDDSLFKIFSKGIAFRSASPNTSIIGINPLETTTYLTLYFHYPSDTVSSSYKFDMPLSFSNIESDVSNSAIAELATQNYISTENTNNLAAIQAGTGIGVKLEFPYLSDFVTNQNVVIQRAELDIPTLETALSPTMPAPNQLLFLFGNGNGFYYTSSGTIQFLEEESSIGTALSMGYSIQGKSYSYAYMTSYINQFAKGLIPESDGLIIQPSENNISVDRLIFPTQKNTNNLPAIKLRMYYSVAE
ncbi:hypothetical protein Fleli_0040 [Bernardetia litoralis DSM 6794]|uniref:DUF4270 family protein n=1 Tax=Bernardetia litoralis (strain ATCC 23117 / DSM 6794 / NBRC 15988 / NCIMB 1366 / Fx l1 / Sio-4) TaxID=880071 RepID=I4AF16_BERLS|nr:hypothetical protein [Bernardetia litoralis]AFM02551.1 hypothetical protein Fleli_0040 [Bernardetia litoralis DSM 6794]